MTYLIALIDNNGKIAIYTEINIHDLYCYLYEYFPSLFDGPSSRYTGDKGIGVIEHMHW